MNNYPMIPNSIMVYIMLYYSVRIVPDIGKILTMQ